MLFAGVAWDAHGYEVAVLDDAGRRTGPTRMDDPNQVVAHLMGLGAGLVTILDSLNGTLDGPLLTAGLAVYRTGSALLPPRRALGSVSAQDLAQAGQRDLPALIRLEAGAGSQTGRSGALQAANRASARSEQDLIASGQYLKHGLRNGDAVALTFDDGPFPPYTGRVLDILRRYCVRATFFFIGLNVRAHPDDVARIAAEGHALGNHTWSHPFLPELASTQLKAQIDHTNEAIAGAGVAPPTLFRPPYGSRTPEALDFLANYGQTVVLWDVTPYDWERPGAEAIARTALDQAKPGSIVLMHDGGGDRSQTVAALPAVIEGLLGRGLRLVTVDDLVADARGGASRQPDARA